MRQLNLLNATRAGEGIKKMELTKDEDLVMLYWENG